MLDFIPAIFLKAIVRELHCMITTRKTIVVGAVLSQKGRPMASASRILNGVEQNYPITGREE